jgi:Uma2 family endonuclease
MATQPVEPHDPSPASLVGPTEEEWRAMSPAERERRVTEIVDVLQDPQRAMTEGRRHKRAKSDAVDALSLHFRTTGRVIYLAEEMPVVYPGAPGFTPDVMAVLDVPQPEEDERMAWVVAHERRGLDLVIEVLHMGSRKKDLVDNVERYASLGIPEYFVYDVGRRHIEGYRLTAQARRYQPIMPQLGRYASQVLGLDLVVRGGTLRFFSGQASLPGSQETIGLLEGMVTNLQARAGDAQAEMADARAEIGQALTALRGSILAVLADRGVPCSDEARARLLSCSDSAELQRWLLAAMHAKSAEDVFGGT